VKDPRTTYDQFSIQVWRYKLQAELHANGLLRAIQRLAKEMIDSARVNALFSEADTFIGLLIVLLQPRGLPPPLVVGFTPQASSAEMATITPSFTFQLAIPRTPCGERAQSIIATHGIEKDALGDICTRPTSPTISGVRRRSAVVAAICPPSDTSSSGRRMHSAVLSVAALTPRIYTLPILPLVHPIGCRRYALVPHQFP